MSTFTAAIAKLRPGVNFANADNTLPGIRWDTPDVVPPTQAEVDAEMARPDVPQEVTAAQLIRALDKMGLLDAVNAATEKAGGLTLALWNRAPFFHRADPMLAALGRAIGKTDAEIDALFVLAATY